ncbi:hypothetical protein [Natrinema versiforme]|uniref:Uncharacterized protein n=1 Tax=Natrinema versiforme TaxID=88724 RepID=A0A4P8WHE3_9EURY|nr:hypothetical protein [Natrinema versiforme]QCS42799.1 hypothetical protein FEJ81_10690 [Natrinema versiforme]
MEWRCTWCGKPHAEDDPPCDDCGHNAFEKAVVREGDAESTDASAGTIDTGTSYVWTCSDCGREHVKHNPPCSRCGNPTLEKTEQTYDDVDRDLDAPGWLGVAKPYLPVVAVVVLIGALFATGIVSPTMINGIFTPDPPDAPGDGTEAAGIDLERTEELIHDRLEDERADSRTYDDGLAAYAEYHNRAYVAIEYEDARVEAVSLRDFGIDCRGTLEEGQLPAALSTANYDDEAALADGVVDFMRSGDGVTGSGYDGEGIDLHAVDGSIYVFYATC